MTQPTRNLQQIFDYAYPSNHLFRISVVKDLNSNNAKSPYFALISLFPGVIDQNTGNRTYDSNSKITMKQSILHLMAIAKYVKRLCRYTNQNFIGATTFMTDSSRSSYGGNEQKILFVSRGADKDNNMVISIGMKVGQGPAKVINLPPGIAEALTEVIECIAKKAVELELKENSERSANYINKNNNSNVNNNINQPIPQQNPPFLNNQTNNFQQNQNIPTPPTQQSDSGSTMVSNFQNTLSNQQTVPTPPPFEGVEEPPF